MYQHLRFCVGLLGLLSLGCRDTASPGELAANITSTPQTLAFSTNRDGNDEIYRILTDGTGLTRLTFDPAPDFQPVYSPSGKKLAYVHGSAPASQIYVMNSDGSGKTNLSNSASLDRRPDWSPDGTKMLFERRLPLFFNWEIYVMKADGTGQVNVSNHVTADSNARWSPSGSQVVFMSSRNGNREVYKVNADGTGLVNLTQNALDDDWPDWSPDGKKIAFVRNDPADAHLYTMNSNGTAQSQLNPAVAGARIPRWSPSGSALMLQGQGNAQLLVLNADGSNLHIAMSANNGLAEAEWSPDETRIALSSWLPCDNDDCQGLRTVSPKGGTPTILTNHLYGTNIVDRWPSWKP